MSWQAISNINKYNVMIPEKIEKVCEYLSGVLETEYAVLTNIDRIEDDNIYLKEEFYIPHQEVSTALITIDPNREDKEVKKYNAIIHRHPDGCNSFSSTDEESINLNFRTSILYTKSEIFVHGIYNMPICKTKNLTIELETFIECLDENNPVELTGEEIEAIEEAVNSRINIKECKYSSAYNDCFSNYGNYGNYSNYDYDYTPPELDYSKKENDDDDDEIDDVVKEHIEAVETRMENKIEDIENRLDDRCLDIEKNYDALKDEVDELNKLFAKLNS